MFPTKKKVNGTIPEHQRAAVPVNGTSYHCLENGAAGYAHGRQTAMPSRNAV